MPQGCGNGQPGQEAHCTVAVRRSRQQNTAWEYHHANVKSTVPVCLDGDQARITPQPHQAATSDKVAEGAQIDIMRELLVSAGWAAGKKPSRLSVLARSVELIQTYQGLVRQVAAKRAISSGPHCGGDTTGDMPPKRPKLG